jgi:hypothetical protein
MHVIPSDELSNKKYHEMPEISSSAVKTVAMSSLYHWKNAKFNSTPAMILGSAFHAMLLEPEKNLVINSELSRRGSKAWKEQEEFLTDDQILLPSGEYEQCERMVDGCLQNKMARNLLTNKDLMAEYSFIATCPETGVELKCRPDGLLKEAGIVIDLKSCLDASYRGFDKAVRNYRYDLQSCVYRYILKLCGYPTTNFIFIATEKSSYATACYEMSDKYNKYAEAEMFKTLRKIKVAQDTNTYDTGWPELDTISLPAYLDEDHGL